MIKYSINTRYLKNFKQISWVHNMTCIAHTSALSAHSTACGTKRGLKKEKIKFSMSTVNSLTYCLQHLARNAT